MGTNVPQPMFGPTGFISPSEAAILAGRIADFQAAFNNLLNLDVTDTETLATPQGQLVSSDAALIGNVYDTFLYQSTQTDPAFAVGRWLDAIARMYFLQRNPSQPTVLTIACGGLFEVPIPINALIQDLAGNSYGCTEAGTIPIGGSIELQFACLIPGPTAVPGAVTIYQAISGWDTVSVVSGVVGNNTETDSAFEARRAASVAGNSSSLLDSVLGAVLAVPNVITAYATENDESTSQTIGGVVLRPNSLYVAVVGGEAAAVAQAIWSRKPPGCVYNGNTTVTVLDTNPKYTPPYPAYQVSFEIPIGLPFVVDVDIVNSLLVPANALSLIQTAVVNAFAGIGATRAGIGATVFASWLYPVIAALGTWAQIINIKVGSVNASSAQFTGSITGTTLSVSALISGALAVGQTLMDLTGAILPGTTILSGGGSSWVVSSTQSVSSETMYGVLAASDDQVVNINQIPSISTSNVSLTLT